MTRAQEERMRAENRRKEYQREDHMRLVAQDKLLRANAASDERVENKRYVLSICVCVCLLGIFLVKYLLG